MIKPEYLMPDTAYLIALLQAKADDDADSVAELRDILRGDSEEAEALLEQAREANTTAE